MAKYWIEPENVRIDKIHWPFPMFNHGVLVGIPTVNIPKWYMVITQFPWFLPILYKMKKVRNPKKSTSPAQKSIPSKSTNFLDDLQNSYFSCYPKRQKTSNTVSTGKISRHNTTTTNSKKPCVRKLTRLKKYEFLESRCQFVYLLCYRQQSVIAHSTVPSTPNTETPCVCTTQYQKIRIHTVSFQIRTFDTAIHKYDRSVKYEFQKRVPLFVLWTNLQTRSIHPQ